jgi:ubiquinone/menaquinone biosynthesis C-methylase UbiE
LLIESFGAAGVVAGHYSGSRIWLSIGLIVIFYGIFQTVGHFLGVYVIPENRVARATRIAELLNLSGSEIILDVGTGRGLHAIAFARHLTTGKVVAIDIWDEHLRSTLKHYDFTSYSFGHSFQRTLENAEIEQVAHKISFQNMDANNLQFDDNSFDIAICGYILQHLHAGGKRRGDEQKRRCLRRIYRILKPEGCIVIFEAVHKGFTNFLAFTPFVYLSSRWLTEDYWRQILHDAGFKIEYTEVSRGNIVLVGRK